MTNLLLHAAAAISLLTNSAPAAPPIPGPRTAVFYQVGFPWYGASPGLSPRKIAEDLRRVNVPVDLLDVAALADPARFNTHRFAAVVLPYGNAYPQAAFANLRAFHQAGGCLILSGIPFTHAVQRQAAADGSVTWKDLGHNSAPALFGPDGMGVGSFKENPGGEAQVAAGDPLRLRSLHREWGSGAQVLDRSTVPPEDTVIPVLTEKASPVAAIILHHDPVFKGAVDVWTNHPDAGDFDAFDTEQLLVRGTVAALAHKGLLTASRQTAAFVLFNRLPRPEVFANLTLPAPPRPYPTFQPRMPAPARHLFVADVTKLPHDEQLLLASLQGLVNRKQPRIYLVFSKDDTFWLKQMQVRGETGAPIPIQEPLSLLKRFRSSFAGAVIPDPQVYLSPCIAVDFAGADNLVIATPKLAAQLGLPIREDLRGKFRDDADALRYARRVLVPRLNPYLSLCLDPPLLGSQVDEIIAARGMAFWVTGLRAQDRPGANMAAEKAEVERTFAHLPLNAVVHGFWWHGDGQGLDEGPGVSLGSRFGKVTTVSDFVANFSVLDGVHVQSIQQKRRAAPPLDPSKTYLAITMSDGDNLVTWRDYFRQYFQDPLHGSFPIGWGMGPTLIDCAPTLVQWYYDHATPNDEFFCDVSGVGYIYPPDWARALKDRSAALKSFYHWTARYMKRLDMRTLRLMGVRTEDIPEVAADLPGVSFLMPDYGYAGEKSYHELTYTLPGGQAVFRAAINGAGPQNLADQIRSRAGKTRPAFVNAFVWNWGSRLADLKKMLDILGPGYVAVTPSQLNTLYREARAHRLAR